MFADNTYSKPYFVTYINSAFFTILLPVCGIKRLVASKGFFRKEFGGYSNSTKYSPLVEGEGQALPKSSLEDETEDLSRSPSEQLLPEGSMTISGTHVNARGIAVEDMMDIREIARLSFEFCFVWV